MTRPLIGITSDNKENRIDSGHYESASAYSRAIAAAGGLPLILPQEIDLAGEYVRLCAGILLTGGADPLMERFGQPMHPQARPVASQRQTFELAILDELAKHRAKPALGICLGMQFMSLHAGGRMNQLLADTLGEPAALAHQKNNRHAIHVDVKDCILTALAPDAPGPRVSSPALSSEGPQASSPALTSKNAERVGTPAVPGGDPTVVSWHRQAVEDSGTLRVIAHAPDGVVEAVDNPARPFYLGVQWHPERGGNGPFNRSLLERFVEACRANP